ncbi:MAG: EamA family transporter [Gammaproteobacteria bacterium]|nr:MAG: EamA family transporter [Gammaproteobacteria bacterium]
MNPTINSVMSARDWAMLLTLSALWGGSFFFVEVLVSALPPLTIVWLRVVLAAATLWIFAIIIGLQVPNTLGVWAAFFAMGLLNNVIPFSLIAWGQTYIASGLASILNATTPLFTVIVAGAFLHDERITAIKFVGVFIGFVGVVVMIGPPTLSGLGTDALAQIAVLGAALFYAFAGVFGRRFKDMGINPVLTAAGQVTASAIILTPLAIYVDRPFDLSVPGVEIWAAIIGLAVLSTAVAYILYFRILASAGATNLLLVTFLIPVSAILLGVFVLGESLELIHLFGMALIGFGLSAIDGRLWKPKRLAKLYKGRLRSQRPNFRV